jgi:oligo-1,6-glucosidase
LNAYQEYVDIEKIVDKETMLKYLAFRSRDNARTPMQWNSSVNSGFTNGTPWFTINDNYQEINVENDLSNPDSIFYYYQKLIELRHNCDLVVYGDYEVLDMDDEEVFTYRRRYNDETLLVINNFTNQDVIRDYGQDSGALLISNYADDKHTRLRAYESKVYLLK